MGPQEAALSPNGKRLAFCASVNEPVQSYTEPDLWVVDLAADAKPKNLTAAYDYDVCSGVGGDQGTPRAGGGDRLIWTADGNGVVFKRFYVPVWAAADGSGKTGFVPAGLVNDFPTSPGPDSDSILAVRVQPKTAGDIFLMSISGRFPPKPLLVTSAYEGGAELSPDRHWILYQSNESGQPEIYVRRYPALDREWQVSEGGGVQGRWSSTSREIYYRSGRQIMSVSLVARGTEPSFGKPTALFADEYDFGQNISIPNYDVTRDGRFIMLRRGTHGSSLRVVTNWTEELKKIVAAGGVH